MKEKVLVEFIISDESLGNILEKIKKYIPEHELHITSPIPIVFCRIDSELATLISLQDKYLSDRMRISYISEDLKDKYRKT